MNETHFNDVVGSIRELLRQEYERGKQDAIKRLMDIAGRDSRPDPNTKKPAAGNRKRARARTGKPRAPRGSPRALVERVLKENGAGGASVSEVASAAQSAVEKSVSGSAIRLELNRGQKERRYKVKKGKWSLSKAPQ